MAFLFFDSPKGAILVNGALCDGKTAKVDNCFCIQYFPYDAQLEQVCCAVSGIPNIFDDVVFIRHRKDYIVRFYPKRKRKETSEAYLQKVLEPTSGAMHCLTCHKDDTHKISVETQNELTCMNVPCKTVDVQFSCAPIGGDGQLLLIIAHLENDKDFVCVLHYKDDYTVLLSLCCDGVYIDQNGITVYDGLCDCLNRKCVRKLKFCGDCFVEESRRFENACEHNYIDEIIPYIFVESVCYGDDDCALNCLCPTLRDGDFRELLGDFVGICDCLEYKPFEICLLYSDESGLYTKTFGFCVESGKIQKVKCL